MSRFMMLMGIPGSGKSTIAGKLVESEAAVLISTDGLRQRLTDSETDFSKDDQVFRTALLQIQQHLAAGQNVVYDATNLTSGDRKKVLRVIPPGTDKICYYRKVPLSMALQRNSKRQRVVPAAVITRMFQKLTEPRTREGWDEVKVIEE